MWSERGLKTFFPLLEVKCVSGAESFLGAKPTREIRVAVDKSWTLARRHERMLIFLMQHLDKSHLVNFYEVLEFYHYKAQILF